MIRKIWGEVSVFSLLLRGGSTHSLLHFLELYGAASVASMWFSMVLSLLLRAYCTTDCVVPSSNIRKHNQCGLPPPGKPHNTMCTTWPLSRNLFAPLVWGSTSPKWVQANVSNSKSNKKFACQMKCKNRWKQQLILVFPMHCTQHELFGRLWVSISYTAYRQSRTKILGH